jgi:penicillin-binding protein 1C
MALDDGLIHSESLMVDAPQAFGGYRPGNFDAAFNGPVSSATALRLSLNVPAVDLLDRVGSARFAARLSHAGINLRFPHGSAPNLSLILGGTGARLEDLVGAFAAFNRNGIAGRVRYTAADPVIERRLMSPGAAWITREVLESNPRPGYGSGTFDVTGRPRVAWKTGTSYGYRDAWAIGGTRHYTVGVWVGRPDGTPLPGQYGAVTALPLMFEVVDSLPRQAGDASAAATPANVTRETICWPTGELAERTEDALCQRRLDAFILDGVVPPTFAERDARLWQPGRQRFNVDARTGLRLSPDCRLPHEIETREIARWPALLSPWLPQAQRHAAQLPALSPDCSDDGRESGGSLHIDGLNDRATLARAPNAEHGVRLQLRALGNDNSVDWLLDGRWIARTEGARLFQRDFEEVGEHTLTALAADGAWTQVRFRILR